MSDYSKKLRLAKLAQQAATSVATTVTKVVGGAEFDPGVIGGVDTDFYAGAWNAKVAKDAGVKFVVVRAGEYGTDSQFHSSWDSAKNAILPRAAYWFLTKDPTFSIGRQARNMAGLFPSGYDGELPLVCDMEEDKNWGKGKDRAHLSIKDMISFCVDFKSQVPSWNGELIVYSNYYWLMDYGGVDFFKAGLTLSWPITKAYLWYANPGPYYYADAKLHPKMGPLPQPEIIQTDFAGKGPKYGGTSKSIDLDAYVGHSFDNIIK